MVSATYLYDTFGNLASLQYTNAAGDALDGFTYRYNAFGQVASMVSLLDGESDYTYDASGQLIGVSDPASQGSSASTYTYDANGNRVQTTTDSATNSGYITGANNALLSDGTYHYTYDAAGNRTGKTLIDQSSATTNTVVSTQYIWDNRNRLVEVIQQNGSGQTLVDIKYSYDAFDHLIGRDERDYTAGDGSLSSDVQNESKTEYVLDGNQLLEGFGSTPIVNGTAGDDSVYLADRYIAGPNPDEVLAIEKVPHPLTQPGTIFFTETDALESIRDLASSAGINVAHFQYNAYGKLESATNLLTGEPIGDLSQYTYVLFTGKLTDPVTGEQINWHRWYDPRTGTWLSLDPLGFAAGQMNLGVYAGNDPIDKLDPTGFKWIMKRMGAARAIAEGNCGDTLQTLADTIHFSAKEYSKWLVSEDGKPLPSSNTKTLDTDRKFSVPNTAFIDASDLDLGILNTFLESFRDQLKRRWKEDGFRVEYSGPSSTTVQSINAHLKSSNIVSFAYIGHGDSVGITGIRNTLTPSDDYINATRLTDYKIAEMHIISCESDARALAWRGNVASTGFVQLIKGKYYGADVMKGMIGIGTFDKFTRYPGTED